MKRKYLLSYRVPMFFQLCEWVDYELQIETVWFWGLFKTRSQLTYQVFDHQNTASFFDHWDHLIKTKTPLKF